MASGIERARAERSFKQQQKEIEATQVWKDVAAEQAATATKTARLRALRLARDEQANEEPPGTKRKAAVRANKA
jgi:hypothetical protein